MTHVVRAVVIGPELLVPMIANAICAGFPSPADDFLEDAVDVARMLITNPPATFLWRVDGSSMTGVGIFDRDVLVVDRSLEPHNGDVVVAIIDGERSLKRLTLGSRPQLAFANGKMPAYALPDLCVEAVRATSGDRPNGSRGCSRPPISTMSATVSQPGIQASSA